MYVESIMKCRSSQSFFYQPIGDVDVEIVRVRLLPVNGVVRICEPRLIARWEKVPVIDAMYDRANKVALFSTALYGPDAQRARTIAVPILNPR